MFLHEQFSNRCKSHSLLDPRQRFSSSAFPCSSPQQTAPPCLTTAANLLFTSDPVSRSVAPHSGTRPQPSICLHLDNNSNFSHGNDSLFGGGGFLFFFSFFSFSFPFDLPTDATSEGKKKKIKTRIYFQKPSDVYASSAGCATVPLLDCLLFRNKPAASARWLLVAQPGNALLARVGRLGSRL